MKGADFNKIIKNLKLFTKKKKKEVSIIRDWKMILIASVVMLVIICVIDGYVYRGYKSGLDAGISAPEGAMIKIDTATINRVLEEIDNRKQNFENYVTNPEKIENPFAKIEKTKK